MCLESIDRIFWCLFDFFFSNTFFVVINLKNAPPSHNSDIIWYAASCTLHSLHSLHGAVQLVSFDKNYLNFSLKFFALNNSDMHLASLIKFHEWS